MPMELTIPSALRAVTGTMTEADPGRATVCSVVGSVVGVEHPNSTKLVIRRAPRTEIGPRGDEKIFMWRWTPVTSTRGVISPAEGRDPTHDSAILGDWGAQ